MELQELATQKTPFLDRAEVLKCKYNALGFIIVNSIFSIFLAIKFAIRRSHPTVRPIFIDVGYSHAEIVFAAALIVMLPMVSFFGASTRSRRLTLLDPTYRKVMFWIIQSAMANMLFTANVVLFSVFMMETGSHY